MYPGHVVGMIIITVEGQGRMASVIRDASFLEYLIGIRIGLSNGLIRPPFLGTWNFCNHKGFPWLSNISSVR